MDENTQEICRVCRSEGTAEQPLYHPCLCMGSIKYIHQECLLLWISHSKNEACELCLHKFAFRPIYSPDMPKRIPLKCILIELFKCARQSVNYWLNAILVILAWTVLVPLTVYRIYKFIFTISFYTVLTFSLDLAITENFVHDTLCGSVIVVITLVSFVCIIYLRDQIMNYGSSEWIYVNENYDNHGFERDEEDDGIPILPRQMQPEIIDNMEDDDTSDDDDDWHHNHGMDTDLSWQHLLGFDGSTAFIEHMIWVVALNTIFILSFAFLPYHIGNHITRQVHQHFSEEYQPPADCFDYLSVTFVGYCFIAFVLVGLHMIAQLTGLRKIMNILGITYMFIKVLLLSMLEVFFVPLFCGYILDISSLFLFDATLYDRLSNFKDSPMMSLGCHWLIGVEYLYFFASFVILLEEIVAPELRIILRSIKGSNYNPIEELIIIPVSFQLKRLASSGLYFFITTLIILWLPTVILEKCFSTILPYSVSSNTLRLFDFEIETGLLQILLPLLMEQKSIRMWLKIVLQIWFRGAFWILKLPSYLLASNNEHRSHTEIIITPSEIENMNIDDLERLTRSSAHTVTISFKPKWLRLRLFALLMLGNISLCISGVIIMSVPILIGRHTFRLWPSGYLFNIEELHELYANLCGVFVFWFFVHVTILLHQYFPNSKGLIAKQFKEWITDLIRYSTAAVFLFGIIPIIFGITIDFYIVIPLRVPLEQTPVIYYNYNWIFGCLYTILTCAVIMLGPQSEISRSVQKVFDDGIRQINLKFIFENIVKPAILIMGNAFAIPYILSKTIIPLFVKDTIAQIIICRRMHPAILIICCMVKLIILEIKKFSQFYDNLKNEKYLIGHELVNYNGYSHNRNRKKQTATKV